MMLFLSGIYHTLIFWQRLMMHFITKVMPVNNDSRYHTKKLEGSKTCLAGYAGFISC